MIVSHPARVANEPEFNVLMCSSKQATREAGPTETVLDKADGLNWPTLCKCDLFYLVAARDLTNRRGKVTEERRRQIIATIATSQRLGLEDSPGLHRFS